MAANHLKVIDIFVGSLKQDEACLHIHRGTGHQNDEDAFAMSCQMPFHNVVREEKEVNIFKAIF